MRRVSCLSCQNRTFHVAHSLWKRRRCLRSNVASATSSSAIVNLHANRYCQLVNEGNSLALVENATWKDKLEYAAACHQTGTEQALNVVVSMAKEDHEKGTSTANRLLYMAMDMALNQNRIDVAEDLFKLLPRRVHVLATSLKIRLFIRQERFWDALHEVEKVLNEDTASLDASTKVSKSVMDQFYAAISNREDLVDETKRFFTLQRLLSKYNRRTTKTLTELILSDMTIPSLRNSMESLKIDDNLLDKIVEHVPEVLTDDKV